MNQQEIIDQEFLHDYNVNVKIIASLFAAIGILMTIIFVIKTYATEKQNVINDMSLEADRIERILSHDFSYTTYVMELLGDKIRLNYQNKEDLHNILAPYRTNPNINNVFGWTIFAWLEKDYYMHLNDVQGVLEKAQDSDIRSHIYLTRLVPNKIFYGLETNDSYPHKKIIPCALGITDENNEYIGSLVVGFDIANLTTRLNEIKRNDYTNFILIDHRLRVVLKSQPFISKIGVRGDVIVSHNMVNLIKRTNFFSAKNRIFSYLDMMSGLNYYVRKLDNHPFILLVNIDANEIKNNIFSRVLVKFIEISIVLSIVLVLIISLYKRETWLRAKAEKALRIAIKATNSKSDFLAYTAHEIRSPLGFILTGSEIMKKQLLGPIANKYKEYVDGINQNAGLILEFITDILDESHIIEDNFRIENTITQIPELINKAILINQTRYNERDVKLEAKIEPKLPQLICDDRRILQAINNLISNSIKYSEDGTKITISAYTKDGKMFLSIQDQGAGMTEEEIQIAFTRYGTLRKHNSNVIQSYGLGLPIVKKLVDAHDAEIKVESFINQGTTITIIFPKYKLIYNVNKAKEMLNDSNNDDS